MNWLTQVRQDHPEIIEIAGAIEADEPIAWVRVHRLPDHAYFNHSMHVAADLACQTCRGQIQEEATHFVVRQSGGWGSVFWLHPVLCFVVPFVILMPVGMKRNSGTLLQVSVAVLVGQWLGAYVMVHPSLGQRASFPVLAVLTTAVLLAAMGLLAHRRHRR